MLRITMNKSASGAKKYYCEEYYKEGHSAELDYYSEGEQLIGRWGGLAAKHIGLTGDIAKHDFAAMCDNKNPITGEQLTARNDADRTVGYDFTFNASKSVSLAYTFANEADKKAILSAFRESVGETMAEVETGMQARVRAKGQNENRLTGNIAYGEFTHFTTRPVDGVPDPHLHSHCFVFNATYDEKDKKWKAGQFKQIKQDAPYYEAVFHSKFASKLQELGYAVERTDSSFELKGVHKEVIETFSRRTKEIEDYAREHNITDESQKSAIGAKTREAKRASLKGAEQVDNWKSRITPQELADIEHLRERSAHFEQAAPEPTAAQTAVQFSLDHHLERKSVASDKEILATAIKTSVGKTTSEQVKEAFNAQPSLLTAEENLRTFITTKEALNEERTLIQQAVASKNKFRPINEHYESQNWQLNDQQSAAVKHALSSTDGITVITGKAGTGKTTLMKEVKAGIETSGKQIFSFAPSSEASRGVQRSEGFENAETVAKLIQDKELQASLNKQVIWIDEAGMLSNKDMNHVLRIANEQSARVILSGDTKQHSSVERGDALRILQSEAKFKPITVDKIQRQKAAGYREAVKLFSDGHTDKGFKQLDAIGAIHEMSDSEQRLQAISEDYYQSAYTNKNVQVQDVLVIAPTHAEGDVVTSKIREKLKEKQVIGNDEREYQILKNLQFTEAEKQQAETYKEGQVVVFFQNAKGIQAGSKFTVTGTYDKELLTEDSKGNRYHVPLADSHKFTVYEPKTLGITTGDKIRITGNSKSIEGTHLFNGTTFQVNGFDGRGNIQLSNGATLPKDFGHFNLGYVSTSQASQGKTADKVIISQSSATFRASSMEQFYVSVSRGKQGISIYTEDKQHLKQAVSESGQRISATELMAKRKQHTQEINRQSYFRKWKEKATNYYEQIKAKVKSYGLQNALRTE